MIVIRAGKFGKSRELPLHPSDRDALSEYLHRADRPRPSTRTTALLVGDDGRRLSPNVVNHDVPSTASRRAGLRPRSASVPARAA